MVNIRLNNIMSKQRGFATLGIAVVVLLSMTIISFYTATSVLTEQKTTANIYKAQQTFDAAQAGLDYGVTYLDKNTATVTDGMVVTGTLLDNTTYSIVYQFQGGTNELVKIISTATSADGTATRVVEQLVKRVAYSIPPLPITSKGGEVEIEDSTSITNLEGSKTIIMGSSHLHVKDSAQTILASGPSSTAGSIGADVELNNAALAGTTDAQLAMDILGMSISSLAATATITAINSGSTNYNSFLNGVTGTTIYIIQTGGEARITSNTVVGSTAEPVNIVVDGDILIKGNAIINGNLIVVGELDMSGNSQVYGLIFATGDNDSEMELEGNVQIFGAIVFTGDEMELEGNATLTYDSAILESTLSTIGGYGKVPGSWKDVSSSP